MSAPHIYIVSGGKGLSGENVVKSLLVQFPDFRVPTSIEPGLRSEKDALEAVLKAKKNNGIIVHTMVNKRMRIILTSFCIEYDVVHFDLMGPLSDYLTNVLGAEPVQVPGLFRKINQDYFDRVAAIEYTLSTDDGMNSGNLSQADIILTGISRTGKTPLCIYLAMFGWKVANVPLVNDIPPPDELFEVDERRVFGMTIDSSNLLAQRKRRVSRMGNFNSGSYLDIRTINEELLRADVIFKRGRFTVIDVTNKPVESSANEILHLLQERFEINDRRLIPGLPE
ncbi:MAG TPA: pyruvate, water dikinase regulatory protein [Bacteroidales bacterium]|nr:pyruvate, water dikinase regulatory protein [Bacteroidales bacterium]